MNYIEEYYKVPARIGRRIKFKGDREGVIVKTDSHIHVIFDGEKNKSALHPTWEVEYLDMGKLPKTSKSQQRYQRYLEYGDGFSDFLSFCYWDGSKERSWNGGQYEY